jgi:YHS domain-containing protein
MRWILALLLFGGFIAGCSSGDHSRQTRDEIPMSGAGSAIDEKYAQYDPVCGMNVNPRSGYTETYDGKTWYFDTKECWRKFHENPHCYLPGGDDRPTEREVR